MTRLHLLCNLQLKVLELLLQSLEFTLGLVHYCKQSSSPKHDKSSVALNWLATDFTEAKQREYGRLEPSVFRFRRLELTAKMAINKFLEVDQEALFW